MLEKLMQYAKDPAFLVLAGVVSGAVAGHSIPELMQENQPDEIRHVYSLMEMTEIYGMVVSNRKSIESLAAQMELHAEEKTGVLHGR